MGLVQQEEEEQEEEETMGVLAITPSAIDIREHNSIPSSHHLTLGVGLGPSAVRGVRKSERQKDFLILIITCDYRYLLL